MTYKPSKPAEPITLDELQAALDDARKDLVGDVLSERPLGAFTVYEYAQSWEPPLPYATAEGHLKRAVREGKYEVMLAYHSTPDGRNSQHKFYRKLKKEVIPCSTGQPSTTSSTIPTRKSTKR